MGIFGLMLMPVWARIWAYSGSGSFGLLSLILIKIPSPLISGLVLELFELELGSGCTKSGWARTAHEQPSLFDSSIQHDGRENTYSFVFNNVKVVLYLSKEERPEIVG